MNITQLIVGVQDWISRGEDHNSSMIGGSWNDAARISELDAEFVICVAEDLFPSEPPGYLEWGPSSRTKYDLRVNACWHRYIQTLNI